MFLSHRKNLGRAGIQGSLQDRIRIGHGQDHSNGTSAERFRGVARIGRSIADPKLRAADPKPHHQTSSGHLKTIGLDR